MGSDLFSRVCSVEIRDEISKEARVFTYPPFTIDFESDFGTKPTTIIKLYNPSDKTIHSVEPKQKGKAKIFPTVFVTAGYEDESGIVASGTIFESKVSKSGVDRILEFKISNNVSALANIQIYKTYKKMYAKDVFNDILKQARFDPDKISIENNPLLKSFAARGFKSALDDLAKITKSEYYFNGDRVGLRSLYLKTSPALILLDPTSGLIGSPEKTSSGWKVKSLFRHKISRGIRVAIDSELLKADLLVKKGKHKFSSKANDCYTEFEGEVET